MSVAARERPAASPESRRNGTDPDRAHVILSCEGICVAFGEAPVLDDVSLAVHRGEVHVLIGPNGAGKTTLANVITGHVSARSGSITLDGAPLTGRPWRRARRGIGRKFQVPRVFPRLTARENLELVGSARAGAGADAIAEIADVEAGALSHGWKQWLELHMVLAQRPPLIVLDEPTAGMSGADRARLATTLRGLAGSVTVLVVEHDLDFVGQVADRVSFMHEGRLLRTGSFGELRADPLVRSVYLGSAAS